MPKIQINRFVLIVLVAGFMLALDNKLFWTKWWAYAEHDVSLTIIAALMLTSALCLISGLFAFKQLLKPVLILFLVVAGSASYFADSFGTFVDETIIISIFETDVREARELLTPSFLMHVGLYALLPALIVTFVVKTEFPKGTKLWTRNAAWLGVTGVVTAGLLLTNFAAVSSIVRNHRDLAHVLHPSQPIAAFVNVIDDQLKSGDHEFHKLGTIAENEFPEGPGVKPRLTVFMLGETARSQSFSLNGYERDTNAELAKRNVFSFHDVSSCGTATETSVPCMFSYFGRQDYEKQKARYTENVFDIMHDAGQKVVWWDNNSSSKHVADRIEYHSVLHSDDPTYCHGDGCYDDLLVAQLDKYLSAAPRQDTVLVFHMLGSHGPSYYNRVPEAFKKFGPSCETEELQKCSRDEIVNAYDNTIVYTDHVLAEVIDRLQQASDRFDTSMLYVSDHGESTGENGIYLHGMPYWLAPETQTKVPMILWLSDGLVRRDGIDTNCLRAKLGDPISHDNLFDTLLELQEVYSDVRDESRDVLDSCHLLEH